MINMSKSLNVSIKTKSFSVSVSLVIVLHKSLHKKISMIFLLEKLIYLHLKGGLRQIKNQASGWISRDLNFFSFFHLEHHSGLCNCLSITV